MTPRLQIFQSLRDRPNVPVVIIGGGINGIGLLRELALQGVRCLLIDRADFAAGASSKSSRMIHGGLRYLETREFALVKESLLERNRLLCNAAHYVSPLKTTIPLYSRLGGLVRSALIFFGAKLRPGARGSMITRMGLWFYDFVTRKNRKTPTHYLTGRAESLQQIPGLNPGIVATATYWDAMITQAERLCIELIQDAAAANSDCAALNYAAIERVEDGKLILRDEGSAERGDKVTRGHGDKGKEEKRDGGLASSQSAIGDAQSAISALSTQHIEIEPEIVINATGAWVDSVNEVLGEPTHFMGGTKGSHLVVDCPALYNALGDQMVYYQHDDGRVCIVFRFLDKVIMGSTDIPVDNPDEADCDDREIDYMLATLRGVFPGIEVSRKHIVFTFCGVRPLPASNAGVTAIISRGHTIHTLEPTEKRKFPVICLIGGKWTTFRALAEQTADQVLARLGVPRRCRTEETSIGGGKDFPADAESRAKWISRVAKSAGVSEIRVGDLLDRYGTRAERYAANAKNERPLRTLPEYTIEEIERILREEQVMHLDDLVYRRSTIGLLGRASAEALAELAEIAGSVLGWDQGRREKEIEQAMPPRIEGEEVAKGHEAVKM